MDLRQKEAFWEMINMFEEIGLLKYVMIIGSWAEFIYIDVFKTEFVPNIRTRDVDLFYKNLQIPKEKIPLVSELNKLGYLQEVDCLHGISRFYKEELLEIEFLTKELGRGGKGYYSIESLGIRVEGLRGLNLLAHYPLKVEKEEHIIIVPEPSAYVVHKLLINKSRKEEYKKRKDIESIKEILYHINKSEDHSIRLNEIISTLTKRQHNILTQVLLENKIDL